MFDYNKDKQSSKRRTSSARSEIATKKQLREDAFEHYTQCENFEVGENSKSVQVDMSSIQIAQDIEIQTDISFPVFLSKEISTQTDINDGNDKGKGNLDVSFHDDEFNELSDDEETASNDSDTDFVPDDSDISDSDNVHTENKAAFIVFWTSLVILLNKCFTCFSKTKLVEKIQGSLLTVTMFCTNGHTHILRSQPLVNRHSKGNITLGASVLLSANTYTRIAKYFQLAGIQWIGKTRYYLLQKMYLAGVVNEAYVLKNQELIETLKSKGPCCVSGDGRCDSPGHNAKYLTYSMLDQGTNNIVSMTVTQVTEAGNSNRMEKLGFIKSLEHLKSNNVIVSQITTDRHIQIRKYIREEETEIAQQFDVWHFSKNIRKKITAIAKKSSCKELGPWGKSITNHLWWSSASCGGDEIVLREKWCSILFHVQNKHNWTSCSKFHKCEHKQITKKQQKKKLWLKPDSEAFKELQNIVLNKNTLKDLKHLTKFSHTGNLEVYHSLYNRWLPKRQHFSFLGIVTRSQLAVMDFNAGSNLEQAETSQGKKKFNVGFSKVTNVWSAKPIKNEKDDTYLFKMVDRTIEVVKNRKKLDTPDMPDNLPPNIAPIEKPLKDEIIERQMSRFGYTL